MSERALLLRSFLLMNILHSSTSNVVVEESTRLEAVSVVVDVSSVWNFLCVSSQHCLS